MKYNLKNFDRFKFPLSEEEQAILLKELDMMKAELRERLATDVVLSNVELQEFLIQDDERANMVRRREILALGLEQGELKKIKEVLGE